MNPCRCRCSAPDSPSMPLADAPSSLDDHPPAPIAPRRPRPSGRKNAHRGLAACQRTASGQPCSQAPIASGKNRRSPTTARRSHLLQQSTQCNRATRVGNALEWAAGKLDQVSAALERTGAATALSGAIGGSAPLAIRGVGMMVVGGGAGLIADFGQEVGGISQMIGGNTSVGRTNDLAGSFSLFFGGATAWAGDAIQVPGGR
jgi:hypothetical protein